jgi:hypothetical protein
VSAVAGEAFVVLLVLAFAVGAPVVLWLLVESETDRTEVTDRQTAERLARSDSRDDGGSDPGRDRR